LAAAAGKEVKAAGTTLGQNIEENDFTASVKTDMNTRHAAPEQRN
jgi:hypothetical protein